MKVKMYIRHNQLVRFNKGDKAYASTFRDHKECFEIYVELDQIDILNRTSGMPTHNHYIN